MTHDDLAQGSGRTVTRARSFDIRVTRIQTYISPTNYTGEVVFHYTPVDEATANWFFSIIPRIDSQGRRYIVEITEVP